MYSKIYTNAHSSLIYETSSWLVMGRGQTTVGLAIPWQVVLVCMRKQDKQTVESKWVSRCSSMVSHSVPISKFLSWALLWLPLKISIALHLNKHTHTHTFLLFFCYICCCCCFLQSNRKQNRTKKFQSLSRIFLCYLGTEVGNFEALG